MIDIEVYQLLSNGEIVSLGGSAQAEHEAADFLDKYPSMDTNVFFARRIIAECNPPAALSVVKGANGV